MCYKQPGPRCSSYAKDQLKKAIREQCQAEKSNNYERWEKAINHHEQARFQFFMTPTGQKHLQARIAAGKDVQENQDLLFRAKQARAEALSQIGILKDEGKDVAITHHDGTRDVNAPKQIRFDPESVTVNDSDFPHPQANRLDKVSTTIDAINGGASTASSIAKTLDVVDRQGHYYADAAGYLGLVEEKGGAEFKEFALTSIGQHFAEADDAEREQILRRQISGMPLMQVYMEEGPEAAKNFMQQTGKTGDSTVERRLTTLESWSKTLNRSDFSAQIARDREEGSQRVLSAAQYAQEQRKKVTARQNPVARGETCPKCFMEKPVDPNAEHVCW